MKVTTKITYSASKLIKALPKMIEDYIEDSGNSTIENARDIIDKRTHEKPNLEQITKYKRSLGQVGGLKGFNLKYKGDIPLKYTGKLYETMKASKTGISMQTYGWLHNEGISTKVGGQIVVRPKRTFLKFKESEKAVKRFRSSLDKNFRK